MYQIISIGSRVTGMGNLNKKICENELGKVSFIILVLLLNLENNNAKFLWVSLQFRRDYGHSKEIYLTTLSGRPNCLIE